MPAPLTGWQTHFSGCLGCDMTESQYQQECDKAFAEEDFINEWTEWFMDRGYSEEDAEELAEEKLKEEKEYV